MAAMVDSCVLLDIFTQDAEWYRWSAEALELAADAGPIIINPVIYSEVSIRFSTIEALDRLLQAPLFEYLAIPKEAAFLAGKCYRDYRRRGGAKLHPLPDFFIGAHASIVGLPLITRDPKRFRSHFPRLQLVTPSK